jgi:hypothetical protein
MTSEGQHCITGVGDRFFDEVVAGIRRITQDKPMRITVLADGAKCVRIFYLERLVKLGECEYVLCWYHLRDKCAHIVKRMVRGKAEREEIRKDMVTLLWEGRLDDVLKKMRTWRPKVSSLQPLNEMKRFLSDRRDAIHNYKDRFRKGEFISSSLVEKLNDTLVASRQKRGSLHWSLAGADAMLALRAALFNEEWDAYWTRSAASSAMG